MSLLKKENVKFVKVIVNIDLKDFYFTKTNPSDNILNKWTKAMVMVFKDGPLFTYAFEVSLKLNPNLNKTQYFS